MPKPYGRLQIARSHEGVQLSTERTEIAVAEPGSSSECRAPSDRRPYERPDIEWEERLEVWVNLSTSCGKVAGETAPCTAVPGGS